MPEDDSAPGSARAGPRDALVPGSALPSYRDILIFPSGKEVHASLAIAAALVALAPPPLSVTRLGASGHGLALEGSWLAYVVQESMEEQDLNADEGVDLDRDGQVGGLVLFLHDSFRRLTLNTGLRVGGGFDLDGDWLAVSPWLADVAVVEYRPLLERPPRCRNRAISGPARR